MDSPPRKSLDRTTSNESSPLIASRDTSDHGSTLTLQTFSSDEDLKSRDSDESSLKLSVKFEEPIEEGETSTESSPLLLERSSGDRVSTLTLPTLYSDDDLQSRDSYKRSLRRSVTFDDSTKGDVGLSQGFKKAKKKTWIEKVDKSAFQFALRMATVLTVSALFLLIRIEDYELPDAMWVLVSVLFVCWFPALDAASVIEKITQRLIGTFVGAFLGLSCGFASLLLTNSYMWQAIFLGTCVFVINFFIIFLAGHCKVGKIKIIRKFAYATILCVLTFCICIMPFSQKEDPKWHRALYRVLNVVIGCGIGALGSIVIVPKSTTDVLYSKAARQVAMAGEAAEAVLSVSSDFFCGRIEVNRLADELLNTPLESDFRWKLVKSVSMSSRMSVDSGADVALKKYEDAISDWRLSKMLFPLTKYDPFKLRFNEENKNSEVHDAFHTEIARSLARCLRIQTTIVVIDGMVRSDAKYDFTDSQLDSFADTGRLIKDMLQLPLDTEKSNRAAHALFGKLDETREAIRRISYSITDIEASGSDRFHSMQEFQRNLLCEDNEYENLHPNRAEGDADEMGRGIPENVTSRSDNTLFFLQLVEHMILRSMRLYQAWRHVESIRKRREKK